MLDQKRWEGVMETSPYVIVVTETKTCETSNSDNQKMANQ